ncbi:alpha/beta hydrolase [Tateyamaria omphalii]|uniref:alpha/beta fold hydrolase n=1 Tax=Tateyamaria omphalii TaxID=299262 RepID=UPI001C99E9A0|nr:alpha/beta hydrolase [Tateyamaria omphalii]MBY5931659.1 alpha/beta hydrolase [Tateyamaria omphalii]
MIPHFHSRSFGSGPRPALAIHCTLAHSGAWRGVGAALGDRLTLHAFDLPNHGKSGDWDGQGILHDTATAMACAVMDDIGPDPIDIIGHSFGATVALRLAIEHPERVRSVAMFEPVFFAPAIADNPGFADRYAADTVDFDAALAAGDDEKAARAFNRAWGDGPPWDTIPAPTRQYMTDRIQFVRHSTPTVLHDSAGLLAPGQFDRATMPALLMAGATSPWAAEVNGAIARRLPHVQSETLDGVGHMGPITHPQTVARLWSAFLDQTVQPRHITAD